MIKKLINWIKNIFTPEKQDPHPFILPLALYEEVRTDKQEKIRRKHGGSE
jgi:hypothetical protein